MVHSFKSVTRSGHLNLTNPSYFQSLEVLDGGSEPKLQVIKHFIAKYKGVIMQLFYSFQVILVQFLKGVCGITRRLPSW